MPLELPRTIECLALAELGRVERSVSSVRSSPAEKVPLLGPWSTVLLLDAYYIKLA